jgi:hypothetical protein
MVYMHRLPRLSVIANSALRLERHPWAASGHGVGGRFDKRSGSEGTRLLLVRPGTARLYALAPGRMC